MDTTTRPTLIGPISSITWRTKKEHTLSFTGNLNKRKTMEVRSCLSCGQNEIIVEPDIKIGALTGDPAKPWKLTTHFQINHRSKQMGYYFGLDVNGTSEQQNWQAQPVNTRWGEGGLSNQCVCYNRKSQTDQLSFQGKKLENEQNNRKIRAWKEIVRKEKKFKEKYFKSRSYSVTQVGPELSLPGVGINRHVPLCPADQWNWKQKNRKKKFTKQQQKFIHWKKINIDTDKENMEMLFLRLGNE